MKKVKKIKKKPAVGIRYLKLASEWVPKNFVDSIRKGFKFEKMSYQSKKALAYLLYCIWVTDLSDDEKVRYSKKEWEIGKKKGRC